VKLREFALKLWSIIGNLSARTLVNQLVLTFGFHALRITAIYFLVLCVGGVIAWHQIIFIVSVVAFVSLLPVSIGGLGLREGALAGGLVFMGVDPNAAIAVALFNLLVVWLKAAIGGVLLLSGGGIRKVTA
jgi:uncharacterized protein (TIRG00374 family)